MAIIPELNQDEEDGKKKDETLVGQTTDTTAVGGDGGGITGPSVTGSNAAAPVSKATTATDTSGFSNIGNYLNANQEQAGALAGRVSDFLGTTATNARNTLGTSSTAFKGDVDKGTVKLDQGLLDQATSNPINLSQDNVKAIQGMVGANYGGPTDFSTSSYYTPASSQIKTYDDYVKALANPTTYGQLLTAMNQGKTYSSGAQNFDQALLSGNQSALGTINDRVSSIGDLNTDLSNAVTTNNAYAKTGADTTSSTANTAKTSITGAQKALQDQVNAAVAAARGDAEAQTDALKQAVAAKANLTDDQLKALNITRDQYNQVLSQSDVLKGYGQDFGDLSRFITTTGNVNNINAQNVATADQYARAQALNNIYANPSNLLTDPSQAGTYNTDLIDFNSADALQQLTNQIGTAEQQRIAQQNQINASGGQQQAGGGLSGVIAGAAIGGSVGGPVGAVIGGVIGAIFCHVKGTMVKMEDGSYKAIEDIEPGEKMAHGGLVLVIGKAKSDNIWHYKGDFVDGNHGVFHDGKWMRVQETNEASPMFITDKTVYLMINEHHRIETVNAMYLDYLEVDFDLFNEDERKHNLEILNEPFIGQIAVGE